MYAIIDAGLEIDRFASREDAEQGIVDLLLSGRWDALIAALTSPAVWVERVTL